MEEETPGITRQRRQRIGKRKKEAEETENGKVKI